MLNFLGMIWHGFNQNNCCIFTRQRKRITNMPKQIGVIGSGDLSKDEEAYRIAEQVGEEIARTKAILICGGLYGVMEACAKGAKKCKGITVGILPGESKEEANPYIDIKIVTAMSHARNAIIARSCDALIAVGGDYGTLSEIVLALKSSKKVVVIKTRDSLVSKVADSLPVYIAKNAKEAVEFCIKA